ncbi:TPA: hypothetical protein N0F65_007090, partial [Lagenidium giganteum]
MVNLSSLSGLTAGTVTASKLVMVDANKDISGFGNLTATTLTGTLATAAQPNITSIGTLGSLTLRTDPRRYLCLILDRAQLSIVVAGDAGFGCSTNNKLHLRTNGTRRMTISSAGLVGIGTTAPAKQLDIVGSTATSNSLCQISDGTVVYQQWFDGTQCTLQTFTNHPLTFASNNGSPQMSILTNGNVLVTNTLSATTLLATTLTGTISTAAQPNITSVGTLSSLTVSGSISGTLSTAAQPNITSVGTLSSLTVSGSISGTLSTAAQGNITSVGNLTSLTTTGLVNTSFLNNTISLVNYQTWSNSLGTPMTCALQMSNVSPKFGTSTSSYGLVVSSTVNTDTTQLGSCIAFQNDSSILNVPGAAITLKKIANQYNMTFCTRNGTACDKAIEITYDKALLVNSGPGVAQLSVMGSQSFLDASYERIITARSDNVDPIIFDIQVHSGSGLATSNAVVVGTFSNNDLKLQTNDSGKMIIKANGYVGIGTNSPAAYLSVSGTASNTFNVGGALYALGGATAYTTSQLGPVTQRLVDLSNVQAYIAHPIEELKNIVKLNNDYCDRLYEANVYQYNYKGGDDTIPNIGFIAQDLNRLGYISLLTLTENQNLKKESDDDIDLVQMNIDYSKVSVINAMMIKKLMK